jgi:small subunit ribosomal protein S17
MRKTQRKNPKERVGEVVSNKMDKTVVVMVSREFAYPLYGKRIRKRKKIKAHDEKNLCQKGDLVKVVETRPLSKDKHWWVIEILVRKEITK